MQSGATKPLATATHAPKQSIARRRRRRTTAQASENSTTSTRAQAKARQPSSRYIQKQIAASSITNMSWRIVNRAGRSYMARS
jgi:hypothetical protein